MLVCGMSVVGGVVHGETPSVVGGARRGALKSIRAYLPNFGSRGGEGYLVAIRGQSCRAPRLRDVYGLH